MTYPFPFSGQRILITGGTGTLGTALLERMKDEDCEITVLSRDAVKHQLLKRAYPEVYTIQADIMDAQALRMAFRGHDIVIHAAAMKHIVEAEQNPFLTHEINVIGSMNVAEAAVDAGVNIVVGISTDKACNPINTYGATKLLMEKMFQHYALSYEDVCRFHLVRYGNVFGSNGSFIHNWRHAIERGQKVISTFPEMTRFWLTEEAAVDLVFQCVELPSGSILIPGNIRSAKIGDIEEWILGRRADEYMGIRPGEKIHETLITFEENVFLRDTASPISNTQGLVHIRPSAFISSWDLGHRVPFTSADQETLIRSKEEFVKYLGLEEDE